MEGSCSTGQSPQWAVVPVDEEDNPLPHPSLKIVFMSTNGTDVVLG
jgi:hypothetical protein